MKALAKLGFTQSYTYFTWRTGKEELQAYLQRAHRLSRARILPAEFLRQHAGHPAVPSAVRRAVDVQVARRARGDAVRQLRHLQRLRAARARADSRARRNISIPRNTRSRSGTGTSPATSRTTSAGSTGCGEAIRRCCRPAICASRRSMTTRSSASSRNRPTATTRSRSPIALTKAGPRQFWFHFGDIEIGPHGRRRRVRAIENLVTGERHIARMGRRAAAHRSGARSGAAVPLLV